MIRVTVHLHRGYPGRIVAEGHGQRGPGGASAACAAASALLKGIGIALLEQPRCTVTGAVPEEGLYDLRVTACGDPQWLQGLWDTTRVTLQEISREWPREVTLTIIEENSDGT